MKTIAAILIGAALTSGCSLTVKSNKSSTTNTVTSATPTPTATPAATPTPFLTAMQGVWQSTGACTPYGNTGMRIAFKLDGAIFSSIYLFYYADPTCTGTNPTTFDMDILSPVDAWPAGVAVSELNVSGRPDGLFLTGSPGDYGAIYKLSSTTAQYLVTTSTTNYGATWADWLAGDVDLAGFIANPTTFIPTVVNSFNVGLAKVSDTFFPTPVAPTLAALDALWTTGCFDLGSGNSMKIVRNIKADGSTQYVQVNWPSNTTCTGPVGSFTDRNDLSMSIGAALGNGAYELNYSSPFYSRIQKSGEFLIFGTSQGAADDGTTIGKRHTVMNSDVGYKAFPATTSADLVGTWISNCLDDGDGTSTIVTVVYSHPSTYNFSATEQHWESNSTCTGGADFTTAPVTGTYAVGTNFKTGYKFDVHISGGPDLYQSFWINGNYMYPGIQNGDANDGSSDALRTFTYTTDFYYVKQ